MTGWLKPSQLILLAGLAGLFSQVCSAMQRTGAPTTRAWNIERAKLSRGLETALAASDEDMNLENGALWIAKEEYPTLNVEDVRRTIRSLSERLASALPRSGSGREKLAALRKLLFETEQFGLPKKDDASAFLLSEVLQNKRGNCLGLSVLCLVLAERARLPLVGVTIPTQDFLSGHLLVRFKGTKAAGGDPINFDPVKNGAHHPNSYYQELFNLTDEQIRSGHFLSEASKRDVLNLLLVNLAGARVEAGRPSAAVQLLLRAAELKPDYAPTYNNLGAAYLALEDDPRAEAAYRQALAIWPAFLPAQTGLVRILLRQGKVDEAEKVLQSVLDAEPKNVEALVLMASVYLSRMQHPFARDVLQRALKENPKNADLQRNLGTLCIAEGDFVAAEKALRGALALDPGDVKARYKLADVLKAMGRLPEAEQERKKAETGNLASSPSMLAKGAAAARARNWPVAEGAYRAVLKALPQYKRALHGLCSVLISQRKLLEAEGTANRAIRSHPEAHEIYGLLGEIHLLRNQVPQAYKALDKAARMVDSNTRRIYVRRIAHCYVLMRHFREALGLAEKLLRIDPNDVPALRVAAAACVKMRRTAEAKGYYDRLLKLKPDDEEAVRALKGLR